MPVPSKSCKPTTTSISQCSSAYCFCLREIQTWKWHVWVDSQNAFLSSNAAHDKLLQSGLSCVEQSFPSNEPIWARDTDVYCLLFFSKITSSCSEALFPQTMNWQKAPIRNLAYSRSVFAPQAYSRRTASHHPVSLCNCDIQLQFKREGTAFRRSDSSMNFLPSFLP